MAIVSDSVRLMYGAPAADSATLNPAYGYLRITVGKNVALLVLGYVDSTPQPATEVWYSAKKEAIRLWHGRIAGTAGLATDWRSVRFDDVPSWKSAMQTGATYRRQRDVMPGYVLGIREQISIRPIAAPEHSSLVGISAKSLQWFEESSLLDGLTKALPAARFAVDLSDPQEPVVYSEQCLSTDLCLTLQAWPVKPVAMPS